MHTYTKKNKIHTNRITTRGLAAAPNTSTLNGMKIALFLLLAIPAAHLFGDQERTGNQGLDVVLAFRAAYPDKVDAIVKTAGELTVEIAGTTFYWSGGRLLLESLLPSRERYTAHPFYPYPATLPEIRKPTTEQKKTIEERISNREENPPTRHPGVYNAIWRAYDRASAWQQAKTVFFLGKKLLIHRDLLDELASIEEELQYLSGGDAALREYIQSIRQIEGFSWRPIAGTASLSFHSYGAAIDFLLAPEADKETYWRWAKERHAEWYILPYEQRRMPPDSFVSAFEKRGFVWGGKWFYFDTMHFEYRPEILALGGYTREMRENHITGVLESIWMPPDQE